MKKLTALTMCLAVGVLFIAAQASAEYDKALVIDAMKSNGASMGGIKKALDAGDFFAAAEHLMTIAKNMKSLEAMTPPKGSKEDWDANHQALINAALKGIGACGEENADDVNTYVGEIGKLIKEGHGKFK